MSDLQIAREALQHAISALAEDGHDGGDESCAGCSASDECLAAIDALSAPEPAPGGMEEGDLGSRAVPGRVDQPGFTPGPWRMSEVWRPPVMPKLQQPTDAAGNVFYGYSISGSNEHGAHILPTLAAVHNFPDQMEANAHLIAAAPALYAVVERALAYVNKLTIPTFGASAMAIELHDALAAARGEQR